MTLKEIQKIIKDFEESNLTELEIEFKEVKLRLSKNKENKIIQNNELSNNGSNEENKNDIVIDKEPNLPKSGIKSPLVGTFYESNSPGAKPYVSVGQKVKKGDVVCIIEAMKIMNEITSNLDGTIESINFKSGDVVGFDDVIISVNTNANTY